MKIEPFQKGGGSAYPYMGQGLQGCYVVQYRLPFSSAVIQEAYASRHNGVPIEGPT